jgi:hypothetical protein
MFLPTFDPFYSCHSCSNSIYSNSHRGSQSISLEVQYWKASPKSLIAQTENYWNQFQYSKTIIIIFPYELKTQPYTSLLIYWLTTTFIQASWQAVKIILYWYWIWRTLTSACMLCPFPKYCPIFQRSVDSLSEGQTSIVLLSRRCTDIGKEYKG